MWSHHFEAETDLSAAQLWPVLADIDGWVSIDQNIERVSMKGVAGSGAFFELKPKGGPLLRVRIGDFEAPHRYSDICRLPFAEMETRHQLAPSPAGTRISVDIEIRGPLHWLWGGVVGRKHASGLQAQTERFVAAARKASGGGL